ncbi:MAG TPA: AMP-binding protein [Stellaceae bacterium]|nr:AMP-binding protein [Stellaceae bacterium]
MRGYAHREFRRGAHPRFFTNVAKLADIPFERFEEAWLTEPIFALFERVVEHHATKVAVDDGRERFTYGELHRAARRLARTISRIVPDGRPVGIALPSNAQFPIAALACLAAGRPYVPIDLSYPEAHNARVLEEAGLAAAVIDRIDSYDLPSSIPLIYVPSPTDEKTEEGIDIAPATGPAFILFTSGSTGRPKGICNDQAAILQRVAQATNLCHLNANDRILLLSSPGTIAGVRETYSALLNGATLLIANPLRVGIGGVLKIAATAGATFTYSVPALMRSILAAPEAEQAFSRLRLLRVGGDHVLDSDLALYRQMLSPRCGILVSFSSTEVPAVFQWFVPPNWKPDGPRLPIGYRCADVDFLLSSRGDKTADPATRAGELVVRSKYLALGLWQQGGLQPGPFVPDPAQPDCRVYHTGDVVNLRDDGLAEMVGRNDRQIKIRGLRVDLGQIEAVLRRCPGVSDAAVIARYDGDEVSGLAAYIARREGTRGDLIKTLKRTVDADLPPHMRPARLHLLAEIPRLPSFKPDIKALTEMDRQERFEQAVAEPQTAMDSPQHNEASGESDRMGGLRPIIETAWTALLGRDSFIADRPWDEAGGDSLKALELWFRLEHALGQTLPLDALQPQTTPSRLAATLDRFGRSSTTLCYGDGAAAGRPVIFLLPGILGDEPILVRFRAHLADSVHFEVIEYPEWRALTDDSISFDILVNSAVRQIIDKARGNPCFLAGYSYGGFVAHEVTRRLQAAGQPVGLLALIDARRTVLSFRDRIRRVRSLLSKPGELPLSLERKVIALCIRLRLFAPLRLLLSERLTSRFPKLAFVFRYHLLWMLRLKAIKGWKPTPLSVPTIIFSSEDLLPGQTWDLGWRNFCHPLRIAHLGGTHASILESPLRERLCAELLDALGTCDRQRVRQTSAQSNQNLPDAAARI